MDAHIIKQLSELETHEEAWVNLAKNASEPNVFYEPWCLLPAVKFLNEDEPVEFLLIFSSQKKNAKLIGLFPFHCKKTFKKVPMKHLSSWQHVHCFLSTPLIRKGYESEAFEDFFDWFKNAKSKPEMFNWFELSGDGPVCEALLNYLEKDDSLVSYVEQYERPILLKKDNIESHKTTFMSHQEEKSYKRKLKRLNEQGSVNINFNEPNSQINKWINEFLELEASGWKGQQESAMKFSEAQTHFFKMMISNGFKEGKIQSTNVRLDGKLIAENIRLLSYNKGGFLFKTAYNEDYRKYAPGIIIQVALLEQFYQDKNLAWIDSCIYPGETIEEKFWDARKPIISVAVAKKNSAKGIFLQSLPSLKVIKRSIFSLKS